MKPLNGKRVLVTRHHKQAKPFSDMIQQHGGISVEIPLLLFQRVSSQTAEDLLHQIEDYDWIFFTSSNGIHAFFKYCKELHISEKALRLKKFAVVGSKSEIALEQYGYTASFFPDTFTGFSLGAQFKEKVNKPSNILIIQGNRSRESLITSLKESSHTFQTAILYETIVNVKMKEALQKELIDQALDVFTFTSPSTIQAFMKLSEGVLTKGMLDKPCVCIGPTTKEEAQKQGFTNIIVPDDYTIEDMVQALIHYLSQKG